MLPGVVGNVEGLSIVDGTRLVVLIVEAGRDEDGVVSLPKTDMHMEGRSKGRHLHVVSPLARLPHLLDMLLELALQLLFGAGSGLKSSGGSGGRLALWVAADVVHGHVLAVEARMLLHVLNGLDAEHFMQLLVAVELVGKCIEQAVAVALDLAGVQGIGFEDGELGGVGSRSAGRHSDSCAVGEGARLR